jgi:hypothetical protein
VFVAGLRGGALTPSGGGGQVPVGASGEDRTAGEGHWHGLSVHVSSPLSRALRKQQRHKQELENWWHVRAATSPKA